jgi:hypothetical protein
MPAIQSFSVDKRSDGYQIPHNPHLTLKYAQGANLVTPDLPTEDSHNRSFGGGKRNQYVTNDHEVSFVTKRPLNA